MKTLHIANWYPTPSDNIAGNFVRDQIAVFKQELPAEVVVVQVRPTPKRWPRFKRQQLEGDARGYILHAPVQSGSKVLEWVSTLLLMGVLLHERAWRFEALHFHIAYPLLIHSRFWRWIFRKPIVISEHWSAYHYKFHLPEGSRALSHMRRPFQQGNPVLAVSQALLDDIRTFAQRDDFKGFVLPNVVPLHGAAEGKRDVPFYEVLSKLLYDLQQNLITVNQLRRRLRILRTVMRNQLSAKSVTGSADVVVSVTSFGSRIETCALAIESITAGTIRPKKIVLWLEEDLRCQPLPQPIERLVRRGLKVRYCPDLRSHKKYFFALSECIREKMPLILIDDDFLYPSWFLQKMLATSSTDRHAVWCYRAKEMSFDAAGGLESYNTWTSANQATSPSRLFFTSGGGTYLPLSLLEELQTAGRKFEQSCPRADDVWLNFIASKVSLSKRLILGESTDFTPLDVPQEQTLWATNFDGGNDEQINATYDKSTLAQIFGHHFL
jgi:hypothetical protein